MQWDRVLNMVRASKAGGKLDNFLRQADAIAPPVKAAAMSAYLRRVRLKDAVAFTQWRYQREGPNRAELEGNVAALSRVFFADINIANTVKPETLKASSLSVEVEESYDLVCPDKSFVASNPFLVHTFWSIGMADPYPDESTMFEPDNKWIDGMFKIGTPVYPESRYREDQSPAMLYIPSKYMMIKIIRACMACEDPQDLWFNRCPLE